MDQYFHRRRLSYEPGGKATWTNAKKSNNAGIRLFWIWQGVQ